ncbi:MAG: GxxExxY protein [Thiohalobacterales bacterium]|nr:GxxExxY protein [Thiohalobacterales bacterium]
MKAEDLLSGQIIEAAIEVHRRTGPGLLESVYEHCLCVELDRCGLKFERQVPLAFMYKGIKLHCGYRLDLVVDKLVILELKAVQQVLPIHQAQLLTYLRLSGIRLGIILNFNEILIKNGIKRVVNGL